MDMLTMSYEQFRKENPDFVEFEKSQSKSNKDYYSKHIHVGLNPIQLIGKKYKGIKENNHGGAEQRQ